MIRHDKHELFPNAPSYQLLVRGKVYAPVKAVNGKRVDAVGLKMPSDIICTGKGVSSLVRVPAPTLVALFVIQHLEVHHVILFCNVVVHQMHMLAHVLNIYL